MDQLASTREMRTGNVWLMGGRFGEYHLLNLASGTVVRTVQIGRLVATTGGLGQRCARDFVAVYLDPHEDEILLQVRAWRCPLDGSTKAVHKTHMGGLLSTLRVERPGIDRLRLRQWIVGGTLQGIVDPAYDDLDRSLDDFLQEIADIAASEERRIAFREVKDPKAGPWEALA